MSMVNVARLLLFTTNSSCCKTIVSTQLSLVGSDCLHTNCSCFHWLLERKWN